MTGGGGFVYLEIVDAVRRLILSGELGPGDRLPPVRTMAKRWHCTPNTVSRAYTALAQEGLVSAHRGGGTRVVAPDEATHGASRPPEWEWASLVNRAEAYLLEALNQGHSAAHAEAALAAAIARWQDMRRQAASYRPAPGGAGQLRFSGSHDLSVELLSRTLSERQPPVSLTMEFVGSLGGLMALARGEADIAGSHLWDEATASYNVAFVERLFPNQPMLLLGLAQRVQGFIVPPGNPAGFATIADLTGPGVVLVNRQAGSGTRVWLDMQVREAGLDPKDITGYDREETTHTGVARAVAEGKATVGLGISPAAMAYGLGFVPLGKERYDLVIPLAEWDTPSVRALRSVVASPGFREAVAAMGGYDVSEMGTETRLG
ncbi:MAG: GntR family transcriptional regulator [Thermoleophilia bacterium]|nr:GntR family transcriptional regulator [Thermoleophilia bacterium]